MSEFIDQIAKSPIINVVLTLMLIFQWYKQHAKEQSVKNNLFSIRRMLDRTLENDNALAITQKAHDLIDAIDATLATLGARKPFTQRVQNVIIDIQSKFRKLSKGEVKRLPNETEVPIRL